MDLDKLYVMDDACLYGAFDTFAEEGLDDIAIAGAERLPEKPIVCRHSMGGKPRDLVGTGYGTMILLSSRVVGILREKEFTGWTTYPVEVYGKRGERIDGYHGFAVTGRCGPVHWNKARRERRPPPVPNGCGYDVLVGAYISPRSWDGTDIFMPKGTTYIIVLEPVMQALTKAKVSNIGFERLTELERSWDV